MSESTSQRRVDRLKWMALGLVLGIVLAIGIPWLQRLWLGMPTLNQEWIITHDVDLAKTSFFTSQAGESPIKGTLLAGSTITVRGFKGSVAWTQIDYVVHRKELEAYAKRK